MVVKIAKSFYLFPAAVELSLCSAKKSKGGGSGMAGTARVIPSKILVWSGQTIISIRKDFFNKIVRKQVACINRERIAQHVRPFVGFRS